MADDIEDDGVDGLNPEEVLLAALRKDRNAESPPESAPEATPRTTADEPNADAPPVVRKPMIDRRHHVSSERPARSADNPFAEAPRVLPRCDSGAGAGFEFPLLRKRK